MKTKLFGMTLLILTVGLISINATKIHTIGDSTMANYDESATPTRGWAMYLQQFLEGITVNNRGKSGSSSKSFYKEAAYWTSVKQQMQEGDYVFIQFAHNDEKNGGADGDSVIAYYQGIGDATKASSTDYRGTTPNGTYKDYLRKYVNETRAAGCAPVLVAPICRMYFSGKAIRRNGQHDLGDSFTSITTNGITTANNVDANDNSMDYAHQMKSVAEEMNVPFIDLTTATADLYLSYGDTKCHELLSDGNGSTHLNSTGAALIARLCAQHMKEQGILSEYVKLTSDISVSPSSADLGEAYKGQTITKEFSLSGFSLSPAEGTITIQGSAGLEVSVDKTTWTKETEIDYAGGTVIRNFYARCTLNKEGVINETIAIVAGGKTITLPIKATSVSMEGGTVVKAYWRLETDDSYMLDGPAVVIPESWSKTYVQRYSNPNKATVWPDGTGFDAARKTQRNLIEGEIWPDGEIDEVSDRFIQFGITALKNTTLKIDSIGLYICGCGGNGMRCHINYSTKPNFEDQHTIFAPTSMPANNMLAVEAMPVISLNENDTLRLRIYPWYNGTASGKTICISDITFKGRAIENTTNSINRNNLSDKNSFTTIYDTAGRKRNSTARGINIVREQSVDGKIKTNKVIYQK